MAESFAQPEGAMDECVKFAEHVTRIGSILLKSKKRKTFYLAASVWGKH